MPAETAKRDNEWFQNAKFQSFSDLFFGIGGLKWNRLTTVTRKLRMCIVGDWGDCCFHETYSSVEAET